MTPDWKQTAKDIAALGDEKQTFLIRLVARVSSISSATVRTLRAALAESSGTAFAAAVEPLAARFEVYAKSESVFADRLDHFTNDVAREVAKRRSTTTVDSSADAQLATVNQLRANLLQLAVDETVRSADRAFHAHGNTMPQRAKFKLEHALSMVFNVVEVAAAVTPGVSALVHFASPALDTAKLLAERYAGHAPATALETSVLALDDLDALADAVHQAVVSVYRLPATLERSAIALVPIDFAETEVAALVAQHQSEAHGERARDRER